MVRRSVFRRLLAGLVVVAAMTTAACSDDGGDRDPEPTTSASRPPDAVDLLWSVNAEETNDVSGVWATGDVLAVLNQRTLRGYDKATGKTVWTAKGPRGAEKVCRIGPEPNADGLGVVVFDNGRTGNAQSCTDVAVLDTATGEVAWHRQLVDDPALRNPSADVLIGPESVTVGLPCGEVRQLALADGQDGKVLNRPDEDCTTSAAFDATHVALVDRDPKASDVEGHRGGYRLSLLDARTGRRLWRQPVSGTEVTVGSVVSGTLVAVDVRAKGGSATTTFHDTDGTVVRTVDRGLPDRHPNRILADSRPVLVNETVVLTSTAQGQPALEAYDLRTGTRAWQAPRPRPAGEGVRGVLYLAGPAGDAVVTVQTPDRFDKSSQLVRYRLSDGKRQFVGSMPVPGQQPGQTPPLGTLVALAADADRVYVLDIGEQHLAAYRSTR